MQKNLEKMKKKFGKSYALHCLFPKDGDPSLFCIMISFLLTHGKAKFIIFVMYKQPLASSSYCPKTTSTKIFRQTICYWIIN